MPYASFNKAVNKPTTKPDKALKRFSKWVASHKWHLKISVLSLCAIFSGGALALWWLWDVPLTSPMSSLSSFRFLRHSELPHSRDKVVYGFLPYWNLNTVVLQPELSHLAYFALAINPDGQLRLREDGSTEPGYAKLNSDTLLDIINLAGEQDTQFELVLSQFYADDIAQFLGSEKAQLNLFETLDNILLAYPVSGINIDVELNGTPSEKQRDQFTKFIKDLRSHLDAHYGSISLSVDVYASASNNKQLWDIPALADHIDYFVVMAYDFHRRSSPQAGPVAPLFGGDKLWDGDINEHLRTFVSYVPSSKLLLGIPFYGYEWQTTSRDAQSHAFPDTGNTASIERVKELLARKEELRVMEHWNEDALSPYISYIEDGETFVVYYENSRSISYKLDYVNQLDLAGVAIWALGYEGSDRELWDIIQRKLD